MRLIFLGTASAFVTDAKNFQSNMLLQAESGQYLLIDCGSDARRALHALGLTHRDITDVYISHLHADHVGGLEWLAFSRKFDKNHLSKPHLYLCETIQNDLWEHTLSGGLTSLDDEPASLSAYFQPHSITEQGQFTWQSVRIEIVKAVHVLTPFADMPSYGLYFQVDNRKVFITSDSIFQPEHFMRYYQQADYIFQDCETGSLVTTVHAHYQQLKTLDAAIKSKMWLYHYGCGHLPNATADGFAGFVLPGQCFDFKTGIISQL